MRERYPLVPLLTVVGIAVLGGVASAQTAAGPVQVDTFRPAMDTRGFFTVNGSQTLGDLDFAFGLGALDWGDHVLSFGDTSKGSFFGSGCASWVMPCYSVDDELTATLIGAIGIHVGPADLEFGVSLP